MAIIIEYVRYTKFKCVWAVYKIRENVYDIAQLLRFWVLKTMQLTVSSVQLSELDCILTNCSFIPGLLQRRFMSH